MKYISMVFAILFCLSFTAPSMATDETQNDEQAPNINKLFEDMFRLPSFVDCGPPEKVLDLSAYTRSSNSSSMIESSAVTCPLVSATVCCNNSALPVN